MMCKTNFIHNSNHQIANHSTTILYTGLEWLLYLSYTGENAVVFCFCLFVCLFVDYLFAFICLYVVCLVVCLLVGLLVGLFVCTSCIGGTASTPHLDGRDVLGYDVCRVGSRVEQSALKPANKYKSYIMENGNSTVVMETRKHYDRAAQ